MGQRDYNPITVEGRKSTSRVQVIRRQGRQRGYCIMHVSILPTLQSTPCEQERANGISLYHLERGENAKGSLELRLDIMDVYLNLRPQGWRLSSKHLHCSPFTTATWILKPCMYAWAGWNCCEMSRSDQVYGRVPCNTE